MAENHHTREACLVLGRLLLDGLDLELCECAEKGGGACECDSTARTEPATRIQQQSSETRIQGQ